MNGIGILTFKDLKFVFSDRKNPLIASFIDIFQFVTFFRNFGSHIKSEILSFVLLTINLQLAT